MSQILLRRATLSLALALASGAGLSAEDKKPNPADSSVNRGPEIQKLQQQLEMLKKQVAEVESKRPNAAPANPGSPYQRVNPSPANPAPANPGATAQFEDARRRLEMILKEREAAPEAKKPQVQEGFQIQLQAGLKDPILEAIRSLRTDKNPEIARLAAALHEQLEKARANPQGNVYRFPGGIVTWSIDAQTESKPTNPANPGKPEFRAIGVSPQGIKPTEMKRTEGREGSIILINEAPGGATRTGGWVPAPGSPQSAQVQPLPGQSLTPRAGGSTANPWGAALGSAQGAPGASKSTEGAASLKVSSDGKLAAIVAADGAITIFDVATGRQVLNFPGRK